jgi:hypothetical protein
LIVLLAADPILSGNCSTVEDCPPHEVGTLMCSHGQCVCVKGLKLNEEGNKCKGLDILCCLHLCF